ncbi:ABC transporter ATP-binding protein [Saccharomonospora cyanea]|uniref:ABC-type multidrug transport system, ATPase component n=1 Tax=Saccharomonospora cyanea NA-134 TaxID=882082 RepID=H5XK14_9PSEU|nr:ABC-type multidrug transport system, ATPase component [Saccharomonospora cyanea NA-134]
MTTADSVGAFGHPPEAPPAITGSIAASARGLRKVYGQTVAVEHVDLDIPEGAVLGMLGPNGSGKTTTIRMLLGLVRPTEGTATVLGRAVPDEIERALPDVGALVEGPGFHPFLSGRDNLLRLAAAEPRLARQDIPHAVRSALERVGLSNAAGRRYRGYSLGMKQRLGLAGVLLAPRKLVMLDEPTNGLDPAGTRDVRALIAELHAEGVTVLVSSHLLAEVEATCTHVAVLNHGTVVAQGELAELLDSGTPAVIVSTPDSDRALQTLRQARIAARPVPGGVRVDVSTTTAPEVVAALVHADVPVYEVHKDRTGLEDLFARLTQGEEQEERP